MYGYFVRSAKRFFKQVVTRKQRRIQTKLQFESIEPRVLMAVDVLDNAPNVDFEVTNSWNSGHQVELVLVNDEASSYSGWRLEFDYDGTINNLWNAQVENLGGGRYRITPPSWDTTLDQGESLAIGFIATGPGSTPTNLSFAFDGGIATPDDGSGDDGGGTTDPPPVTAAPNKPSVNALIDYQAGGISVTVNLYAGVPAESWKLYQNGVLVYQADFPQSNGTPQSDSLFLKDNTYGLFQYQVEVVNAAGSTASDEVSILVGGASPISIEGADDDGQALQITIDQGTSEFNLAVVDGLSTNFSVVTNNSRVASAEIVGDGMLRITGLAAGRASLKLSDSVSGEVRYVGIRVRTADGELPGLPDYVSIGSVSEDIAGDLAFWQDYDSGDPLTNKFVDSRYIYLPGGPFNGWRNWGDRVGSYIRESLKLGMIPQFVYYNIPDSGESFEIDTQHINSAAYMGAYFQDLKFALDAIREAAGDELVQMILEPDFLGYLMQNAGLPASELSAATSAIYSSGVLNSGVDPQFDNTVAGLVSAINYTISKYAPNVEFGWQFNLWASPGIENPIPSNGIVHLTDTMGLEAGQAAIVREAELIAEYYVDAGVLSYGADFISLDKYGLDAGAEAGAATDPAASTWFWNSDHWHNYLLIVKTLTAVTEKEMVLWQLPVGHINNSSAENPYDEGNGFDTLTNTYQHYEDSAASYFFGDAFTASGDRLEYFSTNNYEDADLTVSGNTITWGSHIEEAMEAGVRQILFGAGVSASTDSIGAEPTDDYWWITKVQEYYQNPVLLDDSVVDPPTGEAPTVRISGASVTEGDSGFVLAAFRISLSAAADQTVAVDYSTSNGTAAAGEDYEAASGRITFAPGEISKTISIRVLGDLLVESDEEFYITLSSPSGALLEEELSLAAGVILNDDSSTSVELTISTAFETAATIPIDESNSGATLQTFTQPAHGEVVDNQDGTLTYLPDAGFEGEDSFVFVTVGESGETATTVHVAVEPVAVVVPEITIADVTVTEGDDGSAQALFYVSLDRPSIEVVSVKYYTQDGTAVVGQDYLAVSGELVFQPGEVTKTIVVPIVGDVAAEPSQDFQVVLEQPVGGTLATARGIGMILDDDAQTPEADINFAVVNDWNSGFQGELEVRNESSTAWTEWTLQFTFAGEITDIWNAVIVSHVGDTYVVKGAPWNSGVRAGGKTSFGFIANPGGDDEPLSKFVVNGELL